ncbi:Glycoprotein-N-acetylgalactosamine 3-beta-galactosyltransferase 1-like 6 [Homarus americanus]|uniref:Glycoprotein-N-acetylgalactosamine 3-beta-galactosyltransferase 1-like 6 n=1 Tax=Homarus americanus TaxID=6706 RepID=A0A8J5JF11_HOMAM|nr:Glycoprotein-N-acetylgalactosamine 3-beta-galactosyltransferase 1-like 6 [Homarus americanus]
MTSVRGKLAVGAAFVLICIFFNAINHTSPGRPPLLPGQFFHSRDVPPPGGWSHRRDPRVVCLVVTSPQHHEDRARHLGSTWGKSGHPSACPDTIFLTSAPHQDLDQWRSLIAQLFAVDHTRAPQLAEGVPPFAWSNCYLYEDLWGKVLKGSHSGVVEG